MSEDMANSYVIDLNRWQIQNNGTNSLATTEGINAAIGWAKSQGHHHVVLPSGMYSVQIDPQSFSAISMVGDMHLELQHDSTLQLAANSSPNYNIVQMRGIQRAKISGGRLVGDKKNHLYEIFVKFIRGGVNVDGSLNNDANWIRSEVLDRYVHPGLLSNFRLWKIDGLNAAGYSFFQYKDTVSSATFVEARNNGGFAPAASTGRGWFLNQEGGITANNKMVFAINISASPLSDEAIAAIQAKVDNMYYTHESGYGIGMFGSSDIEIADVEISQCTGDGIFAGIGEYHLDPAKYTQEQMGHHLHIYGCDIHHCRRQGISICAPNDVQVDHNHIHHIGYDDDGVTTNFRNGTPPMFGIDIESMVGETNIPYKTPERPNGIELNYRLDLSDNHVHHNVRGHFVNTDGTKVRVANNIFTGYNIGGISSNPIYPLVQYVNNTFIGCELWVQGDNVVDGAVFEQGNLKMLDVRGAVVRNIRIKDGMFYGSSLYGYFGTPAVNVAEGRFSYSTSHGMGNGALICFEQWVGKVPAGISVDKLYYTVNITPTSFQVAETAGGAPIAVTDAGQPGFNISRYNYGRCYISDVVVERDWRPDSALTPNFYLVTTGAVIHNVTVKNYDVSLIVPSLYAGRPTTIEGLTLIEGSARFEGTHISNSEFMRARTGLLGATDIQLGSNDPKFTRKVIANHCLFQKLGVVVDGNSLITDSQLIHAKVSKADNQNKAILANSYLENTGLNFHWITQANSVMVIRCVLNHVAVDGSPPFVILMDNSQISNI